MSTVVEDTLRRLFPLDSAIEEEWRRRLANAPENAAALAARLAGIGRGPAHPKRPALAVFTAGHGIAKKRPLAAPPLPQAGDLPLYIVDMEQRDHLVDVPPPARLLRRPAGSASNDISRGPAMSIATARQAVETGIALAGEWREHDVLAIACSSAGGLYAASAMAARCLGEYQAADLPEGIEAALLAEILAVACEGKSGLQFLAAFGGLDIGAAAGLMLALATEHRPIVLLGFAAAAAALVAARLEPFIRDYLFAAGIECPLHRATLAWLGAPLLAPDNAPSDSIVGEAMAVLAAASALFIEAGRA